MKWSGPSQIENISYITTLDPKQAEIQNVIQHITYYANKSHWCSWCTVQRAEEKQASPNETSSDRKHTQLQ